MTELSFDDGRIWFQNKKFEPYKLLLPYGMTDVTDPTGTLNAVREPSAGKRRETVVVDILRSEPGLPGFSIETRLKKTKNYLLGLRNRGTNFQAHLGQCGRPDRYTASQIGFGWNHVLRGDLSMDRLAQIQGDNSPIAVSVPMMAQVGPTPIDFEVEFVSARSIGEIEQINDIAFITDACDDISVQYDPGDNGYAVTAAASGSPAAEADVWYTTDAGESWTRVTSDAFPFGSAEDISCVVVIGEKNDHRIIVARGATDAANPAEIAYADVTSIGTVSWTYVNVGSVNGQYINYMFWLNWNNLFAVTNDGYVYRSADGGATWTAKLTTGVVNLTDVTALADGTVWVVGNTGTVYLSQDFGDTWTIKTLTNTAGTTITDNVTTVAVTPDGTVYVGTAAGNVYGSYDNAVSWTTLSAQGVTATNIPRIRMADDDNIWLLADVAGSGSRALRSTDGGASFLLWSLNMPTNSGLNALAMIDPNYVFVAGDPQGDTAFISKTNPTIIGL